MVRRADVCNIGAALPQLADNHALAVDIRYARDGEAREITLTPRGAFDGARLEEIVKKMEDGHEYPDD